MLTFIDKSNAPLVCKQVKAARDHLTAIMSDFDANGSFPSEALIDRLVHVSAWINEAGQNIRALAYQEAIAEKMKN